MIAFKVNGFENYIFIILFLEIKQLLIISKIQKPF